MTSIILVKAVIMTLIIALGILCSKTGIISENGSKELSRFALTVVNPVVIFLAYQTEFEPRLIKGFLMAILLSVISYVIAMTVSYIAIRRKENRETDIERFSVIYSNCAFMGIPLVQSISDYEGVFYLTAYITVFNILVWTHGSIIISGQKNLKSLIKAFTSPSIIAVVLGFICFILRFRLPYILTDTLEFIGSMNTPLAMIVAGATIARTNLMKAVKNIRIYFASLLRLVVIPLLTIAVFRVIPADPLVEISVLIAASAPSAAIGTMMSLRYGKNSLYASEIFAVTTLLSVAIMPVMVYIYQAI